MRYDYTGARVKKLGPLGQVLYPFAGYEVAPDGTKTKFFRLGTELLASKQSPVVNPVKKVFYHNDHLGGVNVISDVNGARVQLTEYDPWGKVSRSEGNVDPEHRFTGQKLDPENGLYYYGARYYDPELARFISPDPIVPSAGDPQSHNRYSYVRNNPVKYIDPTGHSFLSFFFGGIMKAFSFVMKYAIPAFRIAGGVLELMGGGGSLLSSLQSIAGGMSSYIKNSQFQFASQVFGFFASAGSPGGGATSGETSLTSFGDNADQAATPSAAFSEENPYGFSIMKIAGSDDGQPSSLDAWAMRVAPNLRPIAHAVNPEQALQIFGEEAARSLPLEGGWAFEAPAGTLMGRWWGDKAALRGHWYTFGDTVNRILDTGTSPRVGLNLPGGNSATNFDWFMTTQKTLMLVSRIPGGASWGVQVFVPAYETLKVVSKNPL